MPIKLDFNANLTESPGSVPSLRREHFAGMAHFAGTGSDGSTCRECVHWQKLKRAANYSFGVIKPRACAQYQRMTGRRGHLVPHDAHACKYFEAAAKPDPEFGPQG